MKHLLIALIFVISFEARAADKFCNGSPVLRHTNGGGHVALTALVASTVYVAPEASVCEFAMAFGTAEVRDTSRVYGSARLGDGAIVSGASEVFGNSTLSTTLPEVIMISENAKIFGNAKILNAVTVKGTAQVSENARISNNAVIEGTAKVSGNSTVSGNALIQGDAKIHGNATIGGNVIATNLANICEGRYFLSGTVLNSKICTNPPAGILTSTQISLGADNSCSLYLTGRVRCWGNNYNGLLGYGNTLSIGDDEVPSSVLFVSTGSPAIEIATGSTHTCAILTGGQIRCWGDNAFGQLGYGNQIHIGDNELPSSVSTVSVGANVVQLALGANHTCALLDTGRVKCWGHNDARLGYSTTPIPQSIFSPPSAYGDIDIGGTVTQIAAGSTHTCALLDTGSVRCWGLNGQGQLGYGHTLVIGDNETPASAGDVSLGAAATYITAGNNVTCALLVTGNVRCWGANSNGVLGTGNTNQIGDNELPSSIPEVFVGGSVSSIRTGGNHTCVILTAGGVKCWGANASGQLGYGHTNTIGDNELPSTVGTVDLGPGTVSQVSLGSTHTCALLTSGKVKCWGNGMNGRLGYGNTVNIGDNELPSSIGEVLNFTNSKKM